jgi:hypothetical protein
VTGIDELTSTAGDQMTINTDITQKDWKAFVRYIVRRAQKRCMLLSFLMIMIVGIVVASIVMFSAAGIEFPPPSFFTGLVVGIIAQIAASWLVARQMRPAADGYILGPQEIEVTDAGFRVMSQRHESVFHWDGIRDAEVTAKHIFVMVDRNAGIIVPRRSFASDSEREEFVSEVQGRLRGSPI